jgi:hypothetical protein
MQNWLMWYLCCNPGWPWNHYNLPAATSHGIIRGTTVPGLRTVHSQKYIMSQHQSWSHLHPGGIFPKPSVVSWGELWGGACNHVLCHLRREARFVCRVLLGPSGPDWDHYEVSPMRVTEKVTGSRSRRRTFTDVLKQQSGHSWELTTLCSSLLT